jgi:hypothetical protein
MTGGGKGKGASVRSPLWQCSELSDLRDLPHVLGVCRS